MLYLGVWCELQAAVEKNTFIRRSEINVLVRSVYETWGKGKLNKVITKVFSE